MNATHAQFYQMNDLTGQPSAILGSDGVVKLDRRMGTRTTHSIVAAQAHRLRHVKPGILGYRLLVRSSQDWREVGDLVQLPPMS
jgi:hypothetical protein